MTDTVGKLTWRASTSKDVVCYRVYWSFMGPVDYTCRCWATTNTFLELPCGGMPKNLHGYTIFLGVAAVDKRGNISDIVQRKVYIPTKKGFFHHLISLLFGRN